MVIWFLLQESLANPRSKKYFKFKKMSEQWLSSRAVAFLPGRVHTLQKILHKLVEKIILQICVLTFLRSSFHLLIFRGFLSLGGNIRMHNKIVISTFQDMLLHCGTKSEACTSPCVVADYGC